MCKILLKNRFFSKHELDRMLTKILMQAKPKDISQVEEITKNEI